MTIITKTDLAALRRADQVCFDHNAPILPGGGRASQIRAIKEPASNRGGVDPFAHEITYPIAIDSRAYTYEHPSDVDTLAGFAMLHSAQVTRTWRTIVDLLRAGDDVSLVWAAGNNSELMEKAGVTRDDLSLIVTRGKRRMEFRVTTQISLPGSSARMIRGERVGIDV